MAEVVPALVVVLPSVVEVASVVCSVVDSAVVVVDEAGAVVVVETSVVEVGAVLDASVDDGAAEVVVVVEVGFSLWAAKPPALSPTGVELGRAEEEDSESESSLPLELELPSTLYATMLATPPLGTVTTQKAALPAPTADSLLSTLPPALGEI